MKINDDELLAEAKKITTGCNVFTRRHAILLADHFGVGCRRIIKALSRLQFLYTGAWSWFCDNGGITQEHIKQAREDRI